MIQENLKCTIISILIYTNITKLQSFTHGDWLSSKKGFCPENPNPTSSTKKSKGRCTKTSVPPSSGTSKIVETPDSDSDDYHYQHSSTEKDRILKLQKLKELSLILPSDKIVHVINTTSTQKYSSQNKSDSSKDSFYDE